MRTRFGRRSNQARVRKILFVHTEGGLGDLLLSTPILAAVKRAWPDATTSCWVNPAHAPILDGHPSVNERITGRPTLREGAQMIRRGGFDVAILPWTTGRQTWMVYLAGVPRRIGQSARVYSSLFTDPVKVRSAQGDISSHWVDIQLDYARALGCDTDGLWPVVRLSDCDRAAASAVLQEHGVPDRAICGLHVGKGLPLSLERWPTDRFVEIGRRLRDEFGLHVLLTGSAAEQPVVEAVAARMGDGVTSLAGATDLRTLCGIIARCDVFVCPDSGPMHIAAALGVPVVGIFALRTDVPARWQPWSTNSRVIRGPASRCRPGCLKEQCPRFECLEEIDVEAVARAVADLLGAAGRGKYEGLLDGSRPARGPLAPHA